MLDEKACIKAIASGDEASLEELYSIYCDRVFNTLISYAKNAEDAEELLQDVFVTVFNSASEFQFNSTLSTWIYRITINKALDFLRRKKSKKRAGIFTSLYKTNSAEVRYESTDFVHPGVMLERQEDSKLLFNAIETLKDTQRTAYILTQIEGLTQQEVADIMQHSRKSVESLVQWAKANLKKELEKHFPDRGERSNKSSN